MGERFFENLGLFLFPVQLMAVRSGGQGIRLNAGLSTDSGTSRYEVTKPRYVVPPTFFPNGCSYRLSYDV